MISRRTIISGSAGLIFAIFSPNESVLGADDRSGPHFPISQGCCHVNQFCEKIANCTLSSFWHSAMEWDNALYMHDLLAPLMPLYHVKLKIGPVVSAENRLTDGNCIVCSRHGLTGNNRSCYSYKL